MGVYYIICPLYYIFKNSNKNFLKAICISFSVSLPLHVTFHFSLVFPYNEGFLSTKKISLLSYFVDVQYFLVCLQYFLSGEFLFCQIQQFSLCLECFILCVAQKKLVSDSEKFFCFHQGFFNDRSTLQIILWLLGNPNFLLSSQKYSPFEPAARIYKEKCFSVVISYRLNSEHPGK